jgi:hypothetical protein
MKKVRASRRDTQPLSLPTFTPPSSMLPSLIWETFRRAASRSDSVA